MKAYALFAGDNYYPAGGSNDFVGYFETHQEAIDRADQLGTEWCEYRDSDHLRCPKHSADWWHVAETETMGIVATKGR
jgi:hypothetical protein